MSQTPHTILRPPRAAHAASTNEPDAGDDIGAPAEAPDPLATEPLSDEEIKALEAHGVDVDEAREGAVQLLRKETEATMPFDADGGDAEVVADDRLLQLRERRRRHRHHGRRPAP